MDNILNRLLARGSDPVIRLATQHAMGIIGQQFILAESIEQAMQASAANPDYRYSFDMLGEAALSREDAQFYFDRYAHAIKVLATNQPAATDLSNDELYARANISLKLSALHPRFEYSQRQRVVNELVPKVVLLAQQAAAAGISLTLDAEEADRLELTLDVFEAVYTCPALANWAGLGLAVQAYQKRALPVIKWLQALTHTQDKKIMLRLVKGAYWDSEIKLAQEQGLEGYPVFTRKTLTDVSYIACVKQIINDCEFIYPQFASHNAYTLASVTTLMPASIKYEFQKLHGMGDDLYQQALLANKGIHCRIYAPVGQHVDLLPYLIRRLLENGANTSFVKRIENDALPIDALIQDPITQARALSSIPNGNIPMPRDIFKPSRLNARSLNLNDLEILNNLDRIINIDTTLTQINLNLVTNTEPSLSLNGDTKTITAPYDSDLIIGKIVEATADDVDHAYNLAYKQHPHWAEIDSNARARLPNAQPIVLRDI